MAENWLMKKRRRDWRNPKGRGVQLVSHPRIGGKMMMRLKIRMGRNKTERKEKMLKKLHNSLI